MYLIDTDVLINLINKKQLYKIIDKKVFITKINLIEVIRGVKEEKRVEIKEILEELFEILDLDNEVILKYSEIYNKLKKEGKLLDHADLLIASSAIVNNLILVTNNLKHFERLKEFGLKLTNEEEFLES
jgi:predicted nucleic acid-binding protein